MSKLTCDICMDLIPLVKDGVASEDSEKAVLEHINQCDECKRMFNSLEQKPIINDKKVLDNIRKRILLTVLIITALGVMFGISLTMSENMFYNIILIPIIGAVSYIVFKEKSYLVAIFVFVVAYIWHFIIFYGEYEGIVNNLIGTLVWACIYVALCILGILVGFLLHFAFKKEGN
ncbi:hypothetical protein SAMN02745196_02186 [Clostridium collagenovorans DSM 3089]|uniref:Zinc-finger n=1 Tax=Clostridium collagenovorans DSM 3089 TaxID=1121306 RepID=A0A1M5XEN1_9CLOT|nr:zf-HC2 domain-containing protein [Clostridium collagenovorans]SHH98246.1 hypothetical protein SAMN02745196_02186 [Clostridium collagenovorans DSM 3089]